MGKIGGVRGIEGHLLVHEINYLVATQANKTDTASMNQHQVLCLYVMTIYRWKQVYLQFPCLLLGLFSSNTLLSVALI